MRIRLFSLLLFVAVLAAVITSCKKDTAQSQSDLEQELLTKYIAKYHPTVTPKSSGLYYIETKAAATGAALISNGDVVNVFYSGYLIEDDATKGIQDGYEFDHSGDITPYSFTVGAGTVIEGWDEAMTYMKDGSEAKLVIPSKLAYSGQQVSVIPPYSTLVFYVRVFKVPQTSVILPNSILRSKSSN